MRLTSRVILLPVSCHLLRFFGLELRLYRSGRRRGAVGHSNGIVFIRKVGTVSGATAVQIAQRVRGRKKVLEHLGSAHSDAELSELLVSARQRMHEGQAELDVFADASAGDAAPLTPASPLTITCPVPPR